MKLNLIVGFENSRHRFWGGFGISGELWNGAISWISSGISNLFLHGSSVPAGRHE